jgi:hypothetical protein
MSAAPLPAAPLPLTLSRLEHAHPVLTGNRCQCTGCGDIFNSTSTFDRHGTGCFDVPGNRRCLSGDELIARGWSRNTAGFWIERTMRSFRGGLVAASTDPLVVVVGGGGAAEHT